MSTLDFIRQVGVTKLGNIGDSLVAWYAQHDPETATAADIAQLGERANALAHRIAEIQGKLDRDRQTVQQLSDKLDRDKRAAQVVGGRLKTAQSARDGEPDTVLVTQLTSQLTPILTEIEQLGGDDGTGAKSGRLFDAQQVLQADAADMAQFKEAHTRAINDWTTARSRLDRARADMEHATQAKQDAQARAAQAQRDAGLLHSPAAGGIALAAMERRAEEARTAARAAQIQATGLREAAGADVDDIVSKALADDKPKSTDALDRLARLTGGS